MIQFNAWCIGFESLKQIKKTAPIKTEYIHLPTSSVDTNLGSHLVHQKPLLKK